MESSITSKINLAFLRRHLATLVILSVFLVALVGISRVNYLLFHSLTEIFSIVIAGTIFVLTLNSRRFLNNGYLMILGLSFLFVAGMDVLHTLAFKGMDVFPGTDPGDPNAANLATQFWLAGRYLQAATLMIAPFYLRRKFAFQNVLWLYALASAMLAVMILGGRFPAAFLDNANPHLTPFKIASEGLVILLYAVGFFLLFRIRSAFDPDVYLLLAVSLGFLIAAEMAFSGYVSVMDFLNLLGHCLKIVAFYLIYKAIIEMSFKKPQEVLFRELALREQALRASEERERTRAAQLEAIMDVAPAVVWIAHDPEATKVTGNRASAELLHLPPNANHSRYEPLVAGRFKFLDKNGRELALNELALHKAAATGRPVRDFEETFVFEDGTTRHLFGNVAPLLDDGGHPTGAVGAFIDLTDRVLAERALQASEARYRTLFENMAEAFALQEVLFDAQGNAYDYRFIEVNPAYEQMFQRSRDQLIGHTIRELLPGRISLWIANFAQVIRSGQSARFEDMSMLSDRYYEVLVSPVEKNIVAALGMDVTERRLATAALRQSEARLRRLVESNIIGIIYSDLHGRISLANDAFLEIVGYTRADFESGKVDWLQMTPPEYRPVDEKGIQEANEQGACTAYEKEYIRKDGTRVPILIGYAYLGESEPLYICFILDLSEQKAAEAEARDYAARLERNNSAMQHANRELARANRELQDFASVASHDLQEPLRKIQAFGERLNTHLREGVDEQSRDYMDRMLNAAGRMRVMIEDLLSLSRVTTRAQPFELIDLNEIAAGVISDVEVRIERSHGQVQITQLPRLEADPLQMRQLLQNLITNGLKFSRADVPPLVQITGECSADDQNVIIKVKDNGIGFDVQYLERILQPFQRLNGMGQYEGSGIGLAICRKIVERHMGTITAESIPGSGSTFIVTLPVHQSPRSE